ncbi:hypothetical protein PAMP_011535 [Pampus punctatissimus]
MDILNLWNDDPEGVLLDLGFGCDEPDLSGRIPARFINHQSQARGINLQVFLEAQKNRLDLENPDVSNRFRQLEVLQQVTTAFSSLVGSSSSSSLLRTPLGKDLPAEALERRRRMGMLFRRALKKSQSQMHNHNTQDPTTPHATSPHSASTESLQPPPSLEDKKVILKAVKPGLEETVCLSPLAEEQGACPNPQSQLYVASFIVQEESLRPEPLREGYPMTANTFLQRKKSQGQARESFEMEEIHSFDESSVTGCYAGGTDNLVQGIIQTNSCQSDSSGFLEELFIPSLPQQSSLGPDLIKALSGLSRWSTDSQSNERPATSSLPPQILSLTSYTVDTSLFSSPCSSPETQLAPPSQSLVLLCLSKSDTQSSEIETPPDQDQSTHNTPASLPALLCEYPCLCSSSPELPNLTNSQFSALLSPASFTFLPTTLSPIQPTSAIGEREEIKPVPSPNLSTLSHDYEGTACSMFFSALPPTLSPSSSPNLDCSPTVSITMSSTQSDTPSGSPGDTHSELTLHEIYLSASDSSSSLLLLPHSLPDFHYPSSPPITVPLSQCPEDNEKDSYFPDSVGISLSDPPTDTEKEETPSSVSFLSAPSCLILDFSKFDKGCPTLPCLSPNQTIPVCQPVLLSTSHEPDEQIHPTVGRISQQDRPYDDDNTASSGQDVIHFKMDRISLDLEDSLHSNETGEGGDKTHTYTVQTQDSVYISDTASSAGLSEGSRLVSVEVSYKTEICPQVPSCSLHNELSAETKQEEFGIVSQVEIDGTESKSPRSYLVLHDETREKHNGTEVEASDLIEIESLDLVFETSVDGSEGEYGDVDVFFQQLDTEGRAYWAEPIQVSSTTPVLGESGSLASSDGYHGNILLPRGSAFLSDTSSVLAPFSSFSKTLDLKPSSHSVSVQMSSSPSSHIVHRKDVPYVTDSKCPLFPTVFPLDTSTPFRAVQSWTELQIQRNTVTKKSHGGLHTFPNEMTVSTSVSEMTQRPTVICPSSPSFPLLPKDCLPGLARNDQTVSVYVDTELWSDKEEEVDRNGNEDEEKLRKANQRATMTCCCSCDHQCICWTQGNIPYSLNELEEMMLCLQQFRSVLSNMEEQLSEDKATVYNALSEQDRENVRDLEELRQAVKQEAGELEMQLNELAHHYDDSLKMKIHRLLDEQSLLCSKLRVFPSGAVPNRSVATQCCLLPWIPPADMIDKTRLAMSLPGTSVM